MKKLLALAAISALPLFTQQAQAICLPSADWPLEQCDNSYVMPQFIIKNATLTETVKFAGCKTVKSTTEARVVLFDDMSMVIYGGSYNATGEWSRVDGQFFLSIDDFGRAQLLGYKNPIFSAQNVTGFYEEQGLASCKAKNPNVTKQQVIAPSVAIKHSTKVNSKTKQASYTLQMKGFHTSDVKKNKKTGEDFVGAFSAKAVIKGEVEGCSAPNYCGE